MILLLGGCHDTLWNGNNDLIVANDSHCDLTIYVDGQRVGVAREDSMRTFEDIGDGRHTLEAKDDQGTVVERRVIDLDRHEDYYWHIERC